MAEIRFGRTIRRAVIIGQIKMSHAQIKGGTQHVALCCQRSSVAKVVPHAQGEQREFQATTATLAVLHDLIAIFGGVVAHSGKS